MRGLFVTGTDTGVGKTIVSAALVATMSAAGEDVRAYKPVLTGLEEAARAGESGGWPRDDELLAAACGMRPQDVAPRRYGPATSPHLAAELAGERIEPAELLAAAHHIAGVAISDRLSAGRILVVEGVGGLLVPIAGDYTVCDLAVELHLPLVIAARPGLGTINHTLLTLRAARDADLDVRAVVLTPWPMEPGPIELSNRATIATLGDVEVATLGLVESPAHEQLVRAGAALPWRSWLDG